MAITALLSTSSILLIFYIMKSKAIQLLEILFCWMVVVFLYVDFIAVVSVNLQLFNTDLRLDLFWSFFIFKVMLIPLLVVWCIDLVFSTQNLFLKLFLFVIFAMLLTCAEYLAVWLHVIHHYAQWKLWWSFITWMLLLMIVFILHGWIRHILKKEVRT